MHITKICKQLLKDLFVSFMMKYKLHHFINFSMFLLRNILRFSSLSLIIVLLEEFMI